MLTTGGVHENEQLPHLGKASPENLCRSPLAPPSVLLENAVYLEPDWGRGWTLEEEGPDFIHKSNLLSFLLLLFLLPLPSGKEVPAHPRLFFSLVFCLVPVWPKSLHKHL